MVERSGSHDRQPTVYSEAVPSTLSCQSLLHLELLRTSLLLVLCNVCYQNCEKDSNSVDQKTSQYIKHQSTEDDLSSVCSSAQLGPSIATFLFRGVPSPSWSDLILVSSESILRFMPASCAEVILSVTALSSAMASPLLIAIAAITADSSHSSEDRRFELTRISAGSAVDLGRGEAGSWTANNDGDFTSGVPERLLPLAVVLSSLRNRAARLLVDATASS